MRNTVESSTNALAKIPRSDGLALVGLFMFIVSVFLPWMSATDDRLIIGGEPTSSMAGWLATDVLILTAIVLLSVIIAVFARVYLDEPMVTRALIAIAGGFIVIQTSVYLVDQFLGITDSALHQSGVYAGVGVYVAFIGGVLILAGVLDSSESSTEAQSI